MKLDVIAFGAHPDDVELGCGGTITKLGAKGYRTGVVALTRGEMGTRGSAEIRASEFAAAARVMGVSVHKALRVELGEQGQGDSGDQGSSAENRSCPVLGCPAP